MHLSCRLCNALKPFLLYAILFHAFKPFLLYAIVSYRLRHAFMPFYLCEWRYCILSIGLRPFRRGRGGEERRLSIGLRPFRRGGFATAHSADVVDKDVLVFDLHYPLLRQIRFFYKMPGWKSVKAKKLRKSRKPWSWWRPWSQWKRWSRWKPWSRWKRWRVMSVKVMRSTVFRDVNNTMKTHTVWGSQAEIWCSKQRGHAQRRPVWDWSGA